MHSVTYPADHTASSDLHEGALIHNVKKRFGGKLIYVSVQGVRDSSCLSSSRKRNKILFWRELISQYNKYRFLQNNIAVCLSVFPDRPTLEVSLWQSTPMSCWICMAWRWWNSTRDSSLGSYPRNAPPPPPPPPLLPLLLLLLLLLLPLLTLLLLLL